VNHRQGQTGALLKKGQSRNRHLPKQGRASFSGGGGSKKLHILVSCKSAGLGVEID